MQPDVRKRVYLDNTATTRTRREVVAVVKHFMDDEYANPSSIHRSGLVARGSIEMAREKIARVLHCASEELIFTGSGSESNNLAIRGAFAVEEGGRIITSQIEHSSVLETCRAMEEQGADVTYLAVDSRGRFDLGALDRALSASPVGPTLLSLMWVNNEIGTVQDIEAVVRLAKARGALLHVDAVQALPYLDIDLDGLGADLVSFSGHKLYAPKGVGLLYVHSGTSVHPIITGGGQEFGLRSGTENVPYIVGLSRAIVLNAKEKHAYVQRLQSARDRIIRGVLDAIPDAMLTGDVAHRAPNHVSFCFKGINGKMLVKRLAYYGLEVSSGSACSSPKNDPSHVLVACRVPEDYLFGSLRITLGRYNNPRDVDYLLEVLPLVVQQMRSEPPTYENDTAFISQAELREKLATGEPVTILDVRPSRVPPGEIPGSIHIPTWRLEASLKHLDPEREIIVVCYYGDVVSPEVQQVLKQHGFKQVRVLQGGYNTYAGVRL